MDISNIDWVVISLTRTPERLAQFRAMNRDVGLDIELVEATDGLELDLDELVQLQLLSHPLGGWTRGAIGLALTNWQCWYRAIESGRPICIFEDDTALRHDFVRRVGDMVEALPGEWDLVHLGFNTDSALDVQVAPGCRMFGKFTLPYPDAADRARFVRSEGPVAPVRVNNVFGASAYLVSPAGASKLIDGCFPLLQKGITVPVMNGVVVAGTHDVLMNGLYSSMAAYVCLPPIAMPINDKATSTVGVS